MIAGADGRCALLGGGGCCLGLIARMAAHTVRLPWPSQEVGLARYSSTVRVRMLFDDPFAQPSVHAVPRTRELSAVNRFKDTQRAPLRRVVIPIALVAMPASQ